MFFIAYCCGFYTLRKVEHEKKAKDLELSEILSKFASSEMTQAMSFEY